MPTWVPGAVPVTNRANQENRNELAMGIVAADVDAVDPTDHRMASRAPGVGSYVSLRRAGCPRSSHAACFNLAGRKKGEHHV